MLSIKKTDIQEFLIESFIRLLPSLLDDITYSLISIIWMLDVMDFFVSKSSESHLGLID